MRNCTELKIIIQTVLNEWEINDYYVMIAGTGSTIYPKRKIITVCDEQLTWPEPAVMSSILHEIGHIDRGHDLHEKDDVMENWVDEYEADEFAFDAVRTRYGYVPYSAGLWLLYYHGEEIWGLDTWSHPSYEHRWENLARNGFLPENYRPTLRALGLGKVEA